jgi:hypothetical protein
MGGYLPRWKAIHDKELASPLARDVEAKARALAQQKGLTVIA